MAHHHHPWQCPSFFKVMIGADFARTVRIPPRFKKHLGESFGEKAVLRRPRSREWAVVVGKLDGELCFREGWERFVADNSVSTGEFLIFIYRGDFVFDVVVYGTSGCQRGEVVVLPPSEVKIEPETPNPDIEVVRDREETLPEVPEKRNRKRSGQEISKKRGRAECRNNKLLYKVLRAPDSSNANAIKAACSFKITHPHLILGKRLLTSAEKERALKEANSFKTNNPKFVAIWSLSLLYHVNIPQKVVKELDLKGSQHGKILDPNGRLWPVEITCRQRRYSQVDMGSGWNNFVRGNELYIGDACVFEFTQGVEEIQVHIFRGLETNISAVINTSAVVRNTSAAMDILEESPDRKTDVVFF